MRFLLDQDVYAVTARFLRNLGHDCLTASEIGMARAADSELLAEASQSRRVLLTRDRDFGRLVFVENLGTGIMYLRIPPDTLQACHNEIQRVLDLYSEQEIHAAFVTVEPGRHRFRKLRP